MRESRLSESLRETLLLQATDEFTAAIQRGEHPKIEEYIRRFPRIASSIRRLFPALCSLKRGPSRFLANDLPEKHDALGDFQIVQEIGRGGMGIVYEAIEESLNRTVALKILPFTAMLDQTQLMRFKNEAKAAATLNHRHIVPVYSVGEERGVHYYTMQLIHGQSMAQAVHLLRGDLDQHPGSTISAQNSNRHRQPDAHPTGVPSGNHDSTDRSAWKDKTNAGRSKKPNQKSPLKFSDSAKDMSPGEFFREVARLGKQAAEALDHAHLHGILHRDIKPANMLIDVERQLWITDFGLAHRDDEVGVTITGDLMGTVRYMSPEQASSRRSVDHRSDIYSLGISLYEFLSHRPPFQSDERLELLKQIAEENPPALRKLNSEIPTDLATIVHKSIQKDPKDRYDSAADLAQDLQLFLDHKPIHAKPPSWPEIVSKWSVRHQGAVWGFVAAMFVVIVLLTTSIFFVTRAYQSSDHQRIRAETNLGLATKVIDDIYSKEIARLQNAPGTTQEQREFFLRLVEFYEQLPSEDQNNARLKHDALKIHMRLANIYRVLGKHAKALNILDSVIAASKALCQTHADNTDFQISRIEAYDQLGQLQCDLQLLDQAVATHEAASSLASKLQKRYPNVVAVQRLIANQINLAAAFRDTQTQESIFRETNAKIVTLLRRFPNDIVLESSLAKARHSLALILEATGRNKDAEQEYHAAVQTQKRIVESNPNSSNVRFQLAKSESDFALFLKAVGRSDEAKRTNQSAIATLQELSNLYPDRADYQSALVELQNVHGHLLLGENLFEQAAGKFTTAIDLLKRLGEKSDELPEYDANLMKNLNDLGICQLRLHRQDQAQENFRQAAIIARDLTIRFPQNPDYQKSLAEILVNQSGFEGFENYVSATRKSMELVRSLVDRFPERIEFHEALLNYHLRLGNAFFSQKKLREAEREYLTGMEISTRFEKIFPEINRFEQSAGQFTRSGKVATGLGKFKPASQFHRLAIDNYRKLLEQDPDNEQYRANLASNLKKLGYALFRLDQFDEAVVTYQESIRVAEKLAADFSDDPEYLGKIIRRYWLLANLHLKRNELPNAEMILREQLRLQLEFTQRFPDSTSESISAVRIHALLANLLLLQSPMRYDQGRDELQNAIKLCSDAKSVVTKIMLSLQLAEIYLWQEDLDGCMQVVQQIQRLRDPITDSLLAQSPRTLASIDVRLAQLFSKTGNKKNVEKLCRNLRSYPIESVDDQAAVNWHLAFHQDVVLVDLQSLLERMVKFADQHPENALLFNTVGLIHFRLEEFEKSLEYLLKARKFVSGNNLQNGFLVAMTYFKLGDAEAAIQEYGSALANLVFVDPFSMIDLQRIQREAKHTIFQQRTDTRDASHP